VTTEFGADYTLTASTSRTLKAGYAVEQDDYRYDNAGSTLGDAPGAATPDDFRFRQRIHSAYASYQVTSGAWDWLGGLRGELTRAEARQLTGGVTTPSRYARLYPSLHVDRHWSEQVSVTFGASRRVTRPDPDTLNPYVDPEYAPNLRAGNPHLRAQDTQSYEAGLGYQGHGRSYGATAYYRRNRDSVTDVTQYLGNGLSLTTKTNLPRNDAAGVEMTADGPVVRTLSYHLSANLFHNEIDATALGIAGLQATTGLNAKLKLDYRPTPADSAQLSATRTARRLTPQGAVSALTLVNLGLKHRFDAHLTAVATVADVFDGQHVERTAVTPTFTGDYRRSVRGRIVFLGLVYGFGLEKTDKSPADDDDPPS
jgi:outer membrane receptor protein involved in Fe transport